VALREKQQESAANSRETSYDGIHLLRVAACFMVVMVHVSCSLFVSFSPDWLPSIVYNAWAHSCVPVFFMISGFLLLDKKEDAASFYARRFARILPPFVFFSCLYLYDKNAPLSQYAGRILGGSVEFHLWYVYLLIGVYAAMPFLGKIFVNSDRSEKTIYLGIWFGLSVLYATLKNSLNLPYNIVDLYGLSMFVGYAGYVFLGGFLKAASFPRPGLLLCLSLAGSALAVAATYASSHALGRPDAMFMDFFSIPVFLSSVLLFCALKDVRVARCRQCLHALSGATYGIYLVHILVLKYVHRYILSVNAASVWLTIPLVSAICFLGSFLVVVALRRVGFLRIFAG